MFDNILEIVKKAGIFLILAQTLLHLCVSDTFEKYIKMLVGIVTIMLLIFPVLSFFREDTFQYFDEYRQTYEEKIFGQEVDFEQIRDTKWNGYLNAEGGQ